MNRKLINSLVILISVLLINSCAKEESPYTCPVENITIAAYSGDTGALVYIADWQGYFANNDLDVTINDYSAGKLATDALLKGEADISTATGFVFVCNSFNNLHLRTLGTIAKADVNELSARKDRGIKKPADLKGKRIGVTKKSVGEFFLGAFLTFNGLSTQDVEVIDLKPNEIIEAITSGDIDAAHTWGPNIYNIKQRLGDNAISWPSQGGQEFYFILISTENWLKNNSKAAERFLKALVQAEQYVRKNESKAKEFVKDKFGLKSDYMDYGWAKHHFIVQLPQALLLSMEDQARWRIKSLLTNTTQVPNYLDYVYMDGLDIVKPETVTIFR